jgi:Reversibly glycosylated polypeptide
MPGQRPRAGRGILCPPMDRSGPPVQLGICIATNRPVLAAEMLRAWAASWRAEAEAAGLELQIFLHEDGPTRSALPALGLTVRHTCHADIAGRLGEQAWIIPRGSAASRSFALLAAWDAGCDFALSIDDDCLPGPHAERYLRTHLSAFELDRWFRTIDGEAPRGLPYGDRGRLPVLLNHGLWTGTPDLDGATAVRHLRDPVQVTLRATREVVPPGMWFPLCAMNVCYRREALPAAYNLLMGFAAHGLDRFDDIWSGLLLKRVADHLGLYITNGQPFVHHVRASDPFVNMQKEALGVQLHEHFWQHVAAAPMNGARDVSTAYLTLADWVARFPAAAPKAACPPGYFERTADAMRAWVTCLATPRAAKQALAAD